MALCKNVGAMDRGMRLGVGIVALVLAFTYFDAMSGGIAGIVAIVVGVVMLLTAALSICPAYMPFKINTCRTKESAAK